METEASSQAVGVIGQGIIGSRVADCLRRAGREVYVWSRTPKPCPNFLASAAEVASVADVVQIFVGDAAGLREVVASLADRLEPRHLVIANGTFDPESVAAASEEVGRRGASFLDAPFTGSRLAAESASLVYYIGGDASVLDRARPVLEASSKQILHIGGIGDATLVKIATNMVSAATVGVLSEAYGLVARSGIDPERLAEALEPNACFSPLVAMKLPAILGRDYEPHFSLKHMFKDSQYALRIAKELGIELPVLSTTASVLYRGVQKGRGEQDYSAIAASYQE